jgi:hypothetical protein
MTWTVTNLVIEIIAGIVGGHMAAAAAREYSFGALGHSVVGAIGGGFGGYFLQMMAAIVLNGSDAFNEPTLLEQVVVQSITGAAAGGILMLMVGFLKHSLDTDVLRP